ncbi:hypothetical protein [Bacillus mojavensis]|uniref:hypothetical protein n=1 Tax=Bacillus mojavensis TaxID=72360 RepID=UPI002DBAED07|nr:hypothetical protein [Bacillus mojavensis]MEC1749459.1 hypothetical protein [Bacillus mojavensis]
MFPRNKDFHQKAKWYLRQNNFYASFYENEGDDSSNIKNYKQEIEENKELSTQQKSESEKINGSEASASAVKGYNRWKAKEYADNYA